MSENAYRKKSLVIFFFMNNFIGEKITGNQVMNYTEFSEIQCLTLTSLNMYSGVSLQKMEILMYLYIWYTEKRAINDNVKNNILGRDWDRARNNIYDLTIKWSRWRSLWGTVEMFRVPIYNDRKDTGCLPWQWCNHASKMDTVTPDNLHKNKIKLGLFFF